MRSLSSAVGSAPFPPAMVVRLCVTDFTARFDLGYCLCGVELNSASGITTVISVIGMLQAPEHLVAAVHATQSRQRKRSPAEPAACCGLCGKRNP